MKKILLFLLLSLATQSASFAQANNDDVEHAAEKNKGEKMKALLGLSDEQLVKFREVVLERRAALKTVKEDASMSEEAKTTKIKAIDLIREEKFKTIFSPEQFAKWKAYQEEKKN
jgi:gamma-glutamyl phosphate reductase